jgi:hypothetical protein
MARRWGRVQDPRCLASGGAARPAGDPTAGDAWGSGAMTPQSLSTGSSSRGSDWSSVEGADGGIAFDRSSDRMACTVGHRGWVGLRGARPGEPQHALVAWRRAARRR